MADDGEAACLHRLHSGAAWHGLNPTHVYFSSLINYMRSDERTRKNYSMATINAALLQL